MSKRKNRSSKICLIFLSLIALLTIHSVTVFAQNKCSKSGDAQKFTFHNATTKPVEIKVVSNDCKEGGGKLLKAGDKAGGTSYTGVVFRIYEFGTGRLISEVVLEKSKPLYTISEPKKSTAKSAIRIKPDEGFLKATNEIRAKRNLSPMKLDQRLTNACQFLADLMAEVDKGYPVHKASELGKKKQYKKRNKAKQRLVFYGWDKKNTAHFEATALDTVQEYNLIGNNFANIWANSNTHDKPFFDKHRVKYNRVGFGVAKAKRGTNRYYACAIFGREKN